MQNTDNVDITEAKYHSQKSNYNNVIISILKSKLAHKDNPFLRISALLYIFQQQQLYNLNRKMGNQQICQNCERIDIESNKHNQATNKRQAVTLDYHRKAPEEQIKAATKLTPPEIFRDHTGQGRVQYQEGWIYEGSLVKGVREGRGKMTWPTGDYYQGEFFNGKANGKGVFQVSNGTRYEGEFINDQMIRGQRVSADGSEHYAGSFKNHKFNGHGVLTVANQYVYEGMFVSNMMEGSGRIVYADGSQYVGAFRMNRKHGEGIYIDSKKIRYQGCWKEGELAPLQVNQMRVYQPGYRIIC